MSSTSIRIEPEEIHIHADRRLAFQVLTAFGVAQPESQASSRVLQHEDGRLLVEFVTPIPGLFGRTKVHRTVEWVTLREPERIDFEAVESPLATLHDAFILEAEDGCTRFRYESEFSVSGWVFGRVFGVVYVRPLLKRFMRQHLIELKETIEARARKSKVFPQQPCSVQ